MLRILHTSDWHLGARLGEFSRLDEQRAVLSEIRTIADKEAVDAVIVAGDVFDTFNPPNEAVELLYRELKLLARDGSRPVVVIAGNHDSPDRIEAPDPLARECGIFFIGYPDTEAGATELSGGLCMETLDRGIYEFRIPGRPPLRILATPYANENRLRRYLGEENRDAAVSQVLGNSWAELARSYCGGGSVNLLAAHLFMTEDSGAAGDDAAGDDAGTAEPEEERSILHPGGLEMIPASLVPEGIQYTALGHLHRAGFVREEPSPVCYSGSPLAFGLSEEDQQKYVFIIDAEPGESAVVRMLPLGSGRRILRKRFDSVRDAADWLRQNPDCYIELIIKTGSYISAEDRALLAGCHDGITAVVPDAASPQGSCADGDQKRGEMPDPEKSMEELFKTFFEAETENPPDEAMLGIFREITAYTGEDE